MFTTAAQLLDLTDSKDCSKPPDALCDVLFLDALTSSVRPRCIAIQTGFQTLTVRHYNSVHSAHRTVLYNRPISPFTNPDYGTDTHRVLLEKLLLVLRDGRKLLGVLRTWDQFANLVLTDTRERYFVTVPASGTPPSSTEDPAAASQPRRLYCDIPRGTYLVRGENVLVLGEVDLDRDDEPPVGYEEGDVEEVFRLQKEADLKRKKDDKVRGKKAGEFWGGELEGSGEVLF